MTDRGERFLGLAPIKREGGIYSDEPELQEVIEKNYQMMKDNPLIALVQRLLDENRRLKYDLREALGEEDD
jgi:hypothetical protein